MGGRLIAKATVADGFNGHTAEVALMLEGNRVYEFHAGGNHWSGIEADSVAVAFAKIQQTSRYRNVTPA